MNALTEPAAPAGDERTQMTAASRRVLRAALLALVVVGALVLLARFDAAPVQEPLDLDINLVAAERLVDGDSLYEAGPESRARAVEIGGPSMRGAFTKPTNSFVGPPSTALVHVPFTWLSHGSGVFVFRLLALGGMIGSLGLVARCLTEGWRLDGFLLGTGVLLLASATFETVQLGQSHELVMLGLALAIWGTKRERWGWVGLGIGLAAVLKISPMLLLGYLLLRGRRQVLPGFLASAAGLTVAAAVVGRPHDLVVWLRDVAPEVSRGVVRTINQSLPALLSRLGAPAGDLSSSAEIGAIRLVAIPLAAGAAVLLWRARRDRSIDPLELGLLVLVCLAIGPLTWMHYAVWACLPIVLLGEPGRWRHLERREVGVRFIATIIGIAFLVQQVGQPTEHDVRSDSALRVTTSPGLWAVLTLLAVCAATISQAGHPEGSRSAAPVGQPVALADAPMSRAGRGRLVGDQRRKTALAEASGSLVGVSSEPPLGHNAAVSGDEG